MGGGSRGGGGSQGSLLRPIATTSSGTPTTSSLAFGLGDTSSTSSSPRGPSHNQTAAGSTTSMLSSTGTTSTASAAAVASTSSATVVTWGDEVTRSGQLVGGFLPLKSSKKTVFAVLGSRALELHKSEKARARGDQPRRIIDLATTFNVHDNHRDAKLRSAVCLCWMGPDETLVLRAESDAETKEWAEALLAAAIRARALRFGMPVQRAEFFECAWDVQVVAEPKFKQKIPIGSEVPNICSRMPSLAGPRRLCFYPHTILLCKRRIEPVLEGAVPSRIPPFHTDDYLELQRPFVASYGARDRYFLMIIGRQAVTGACELYAQCESEEMAREIYQRLDAIIERESRKRANGQIMGSGGPSGSGSSAGGINSIGSSGSGLHHRERSHTQPYNHAATNHNSHHHHHHRQRLATGYAAATATAATAQQQQQQQILHPHSSDVIYTNVDAGASPSAPSLQQRVGSTASSAAARSARERRQRLRDLKAAVDSADELLASMASIQDTVAAVAAVSAPMQSKRSIGNGAGSGVPVGWGTPRPSYGQIAGFHHKRAASPASSSAIGIGVGSRKPSATLAAPATARGSLSSTNGTTVSTVTTLPHSHLIFPSQASTSASPPATTTTGTENNYQPMTVAQSVFDWTAPTTIAKGPSAPQASATDTEDSGGTLRSEHNITTVNAANRHLEQQQQQQQQQQYQHVDAKVQLVECRDAPDVAGEPYTTMGFAEWPAPSSPTAIEKAKETTVLGVGTDETRSYVSDSSDSCYSSSIHVLGHGGGSSYSGGTTGGTPPHGGLSSQLTSRAYSFGGARTQPCAPPTTLGGSKLSGQHHHHQHHQQQQQQQQQQRVQTATGSPQRSVTNTTASSSASSTPPALATPQISHPGQGAAATATTTTTTTATTTSTPTATADDPRKRAFSLGSKSFLTRPFRKSSAQRTARHSQTSASGLSLASSSHSSALLPSSSSTHVSSHALSSSMATSATTTSGDVNAETRLRSDSLGTSGQQSAATAATTTRQGGGHHRKQHQHQQQPLDDHLAEIDFGNNNNSSSNNMQNHHTSGSLHSVESPTARSRTSSFGVTMASAAQNSAQHMEKPSTQLLKQCRNVSSTTSTSTAVPTSPSPPAATAAAAAQFNDTSDYVIAPMLAPPGAPPPPQPSLDLLASLTNTALKKASTATMTAGSGSAAQLGAGDRRRSSGSTASRRSNTTVSGTAESSSIDSSCPPLLPPPPPSSSSSKGLERIREQASPRQSSTSAATTDEIEGGDYTLMEASASIRSIGSASQQQLLAAVIEETECPWGVVVGGNGLHQTAYDYKEPLNYACIVAPNSSSTSGGGASATTVAAATAAAVAAVPTASVDYAILK